MRARRDRGRGPRESHRRQDIRLAPTIARATPARRARPSPAAIAHGPARSTAIGVGGDEAHAAARARVRRGRPSERSTVAPGGRAGRRGRDRRARRARRMRDGSPTARPRTDHVPRRALRSTPARRARRTNGGASPVAERLGWPRSPRLRAHARMRALAPADRARAARALEERATRARARNARRAGRASLFGAARAAARARRRRCQLAPSPGGRPRSRGARSTPPPCSYGGVVAVARGVGGICIYSASSKLPA